MSGQVTLVGRITKRVVFSLRSQDHRQQAKSTTEPTQGQSPQHKCRRALRPATGEGIEAGTALEPCPRGSREGLRRPEPKEGIVASQVWKTMGQYVRPAETRACRATG